jgi:hypothetical protein
MVEVKYAGRLGNNLFQYCFGRIIAEKLGYKLKADPVPGFPNTAKQIEGADYSTGYPVQIITHDSPDKYDGDYSKVLSWKNKNLDLQSIAADITRRKIVVEGFFQRYEYYKPYKELIKNDWLLTDINISDRIDPDDVVVCVRRNDYVLGGHALPLSYYKEALSRLRYRKIFICTDSVNDPLILLLKYKYSAVVQATNTLNDLKFISLFNKIIISNSSFYWWAAFLSNAKEIYSPVPLRGYWSRETPEIDLKIYDESRYIHIKCKDIYKESLSEKLIKFKKKVGNKAKYLASRWHLSEYPGVKNSVTLAVPNKLQPPPHSYAGYDGPWIENWFYSYWQRNQKKLAEEKRVNRIYVPIFWTDYYVRYGLQKKHSEIQNFVKRNIKPDKKYFTIVQNDDGILEEVPKNVLIFSAGGKGDIPIPLIKGDPRPVERKRDIRASFMGPLEGPHNLTGVKSKMYSMLKDKKGFYFGRGTMSEFIDITSRSVFTLCPRGYGRSSFRLYEAMALGSIPIYIWDDMEWLPYKDILNWDEFSISINVKDISSLPAIIDAHTPEIVKRKQEKIKELHDQYFTYEATCRQIISMLV